MTQREDFLRKFNDAFLTNDLDFIIEQLTDDIEWDMVGDQKMKGKAEVRQLMESAGNGSTKLTEIQTDHMITQGNHAAVNGTMVMKEKDKTIAYGFCDVYTFEDKTEKIKAMTSYVIALNK